MHVLQRGEIPPYCAVSQELFVPGRVGQGRVRAGSGRGIMEVITVECELSLDVLDRFKVVSLFRLSSIIIESVWSETISLRDASQTYTTLNIL